MFVTRFADRSMLRMAIAGLGVLLAAAGVSAGASPRNVVLMIGDDQGLQAGCYGDKVIQTPGMDRLAAAGTRFAHAFAAVSSCSPSRSVIFTGQFNHTNGQYGLAHEPHNFSSFQRVRSLPLMLYEAGYRTAYIGKHHVEPIEAYPFEEQLPCPGGPRSVAKMAESARKFIAASDNRPFFLMVGFTDPHRAKDGYANEGKYPGVKQVRYKPEDIPVPAWLPDKPEVRQDLADYYESISRLDQGIGLFLDAIKDTGREKDTLVIYVSDNGPPFPGAKTNLYEPGIHLPLIVSAPGQTRRGVTCSGLVSFVDITPTILEWAGVKPPKDVAGRSLVPILDEDEPQGWDTVYGSHSFHEVTMYYPMRMIRTRKYKYILNLAHCLEYPFASDIWGSATWQSILRDKDTHCGKRTVKALLQRPKEELYDLSSDPDEVNNLAGDPGHAEVLGELRARLKRWREETKDQWLILDREEK
jgi:N-sulfoglucosamine sulfohydrolase